MNEDCILRAHIPLITNIVADTRQRKQLGLKLAQILQLFGGVFNKTITPLALVGYEIVIANLALRASLAIYHLISKARSWNNCFMFVLVSFPRARERLKTLASQNFGETKMLDNKSLIRYFSM